MIQSFNPADLGARAFARLCMSIVVPRPIGWTSTLSMQGERNLAPFSFFNLVDSAPPMVMLAIGRRQGQLKDTLRNIMETNEFVVNIADEALAEALMLTSGEYGAEVDEAALARLELLPSARVRPPRVALAPAALEVIHTQTVPVRPGGYMIVVGEVVYAHVREGLVRPSGLVDAQRLRPLARLGGDEFATLGQVFELARPPADAARSASDRGRS